MAKKASLQFSKRAGAEFPIKIALASCNQTGGDWPRNMKNIMAAIDKAASERADILLLEELGLSAYDRGDDFFYSANKTTRRLLQDIADYAASKDANLIVSVGHPWYFADKNIPDEHDRRKNPLFNRSNLPFNVQTLVTGGEIIAMSAKSYLYNTNIGYEKRHFEEWSDAHANRYRNAHGRGREGTIMIELPGLDDIPAKVIPFGSPVVQFAQDWKKMNVFQTICEMKWVGSRFDGAVDNSNFERDNPLAQKARHYDITVALNPNASPPAPNKIDKHYELDILNSAYCGVFADVDGVGSSGSTFAQFGTRLIVQKGAILAEGTRLVMQDVGYTSQAVMVKPAITKSHRPHATVQHGFADKHAPALTDGRAKWENGPRREMEEEVRNEALWQFDYERKSGLLQYGVFEALSGGNDSCYNTVVRGYLKVELACKELGVEGYLNEMGNPPFRNEVLTALHEQGEKAAKRVIMYHTLTCVFMGTNNSDSDTLRAARTLIEGGVTEDGKQFDGIGGKFYALNVQPLFEDYALVYARVNVAELTKSEERGIRKGLSHILHLRQEDATQEQLARKIDRLKARYPGKIPGTVLSYANPDHKLAYENLQAALRQVVGGRICNIEKKLGIANPNLDEMANGYATYGGDEHGGMVAGNAHKGKAREREHMRLLYEFGLEGVEPVKALHYTNKLAPSAGLQPLGKDGKTQQFDEDQLGRTFEQMEPLRLYMLHERPLSQNERKNNPVEVFEKCRVHPAFADDDIETVHDRVLLSYAKWAGSTQAKIHAGAVPQIYDGNVDHQTSLRTPNVSANQRPEQAQMTLHVLGLMAAREGLDFEKLTGGRTMDSLMHRALEDKAFNARLASPMWTPDAKDGREMKIASLYAHIRQNGFEAIAAETDMSARLAQAAGWRKNRPAP